MAKGNIRYIIGRETPALEALLGPDRMYGPPLLGRPPAEPPATADSARRLYLAMRDAREGWWTPAA